MIPARLFLFLAAAVAAVLVSACNSAPRNPAATRLLALGDSYTIGEGVESAGRWPVQLANALRAEGRLLAPTILARTGWTANELEDALRSSKIAGPFDLVTLLIGVNDQFRGGTAENYRADFARLLQRAIELAGGEPKRVVVLSIPDWGATPFAATRNPAAIGSEIDAFNKVNSEEARRRGVHHIDVTAISREARRDPALLAPDGLHPSARMYARWSESLLPVVRQIINTPP